MKFWIVALSFLPVVFCNSNDRPVVDAPAGKYRGHILKSRNGRDVLAFQGIPYALPPIGALRLKDPVKMPKLEDMFEADKDSAYCFQPAMDLPQVKNISAYSGSEDCLYLNVYRPKIKDEDTLLPVLVWIHGGGFVMGSASYLWSNPSFFMDRDMVFVAMNYRLGILGFLSTGDNVVPGNLGMKDQVLALKWVQENIKAFGGDPDLVTINGMSSGAASVSLQMHSPLSKGLFHRVIAQSGTAHCPFATKTKEQAKHDARIIASYLGCSDDTEQLLKCLQKMPKHDIFEAATVPFIPWYMGMYMHFVPAIEEESEGAFLTQESFDKPSEIPLIASVTSHEGMHVISGLLMSATRYQGNKTLLLENIDDFIEDAIALWGSFSGHPEEKEITQAIMKFYFGENGSKDVTELKMIDLSSDLAFNYGLSLTGRKERGPTYIYKFSYKGSLSVFFPGFSTPERLEDGVGHGEESLYLTDVPILPEDKTFSEEDIAISNQLLDIWHNFMITGEPTPESKLWKESNRGVNYLDITNQGLHMKSNMFQSRMEFLDSLNIDRSLIHHDEL